MLLRSSSTPVLGSLLSSFLSESPSSHHNSETPTTTKRPPTTMHQNPKKLPFLQAAGSLNHTTFSLNSSSISPSVAEFPSGNQCSENGFERAQSEGNLEGLANASCNPDELRISNPPKKFSRRPNSSMLETIQSFSCHCARNRYEDEDEDEEEKIELSEENVGLFENSIRGEENSMAVRGRELNLEKQNMGLNDEMTSLNAYRSLGLEENKEHSPEMYLAGGLGVDSNVNIGFGDGGEHNGCVRGGGSGGGDGGNGNGNSNGPGIEEHYKRLVEENPGNPLFLRNYAQFLYESKGDLSRAEEYYSRAILADPKDGDVLSKHVKLVWELHHDQDRASSYFERAVQA